MIDDVLKGIWKGEIDSGNGPHQHQQKTPEADRAVQIPIEELPIRFQVDSEAPPPIRYTGPPDDEARHAQKR